jgi:hypothetical protein
VYENTRVVDKMDFENTAFLQKIAPSALEMYVKVGELS